MSLFRKILPIELLAASCLPITALWAQTPDQVAYLSPNQAESGKPFQVTVSGKTTLCNPRFSHHSVRTGDGILYLTVLAENDPLSKCSAGEHDYATDFRIPALNADTLEVELYLPPACAFSSSPCPIANQPFYAGRLFIRDSASLYYAVRPKRVDADKAFDLFLTRKDFTCGNEFSSLATNISGHSLFLTYTSRLHPEALCPAILLDYGPTFKVPAMKPGVYQVFASPMPYCPTPEPCPLKADLPAPSLSGALTVGDGTVSLQPSVNPSGKEKPEAGRGRLSIDDRLGVRGWWHAAAVSLTGRRVNENAAEGR